MVLISQSDNLKRSVEKPLLQSDWTTFVFNTVSLIAFSDVKGTHTNPRTDEPRARVE